MDMHVKTTSSGAAGPNPHGPTPAGQLDNLHLSDARLDELMRWHGVDESNLPPAHTLQNLSRDTVAAIEELRRARVAIEVLRAAMARAFWATEFRDVHSILLEALGPPPEELAA